MRQASVRLAPGIAAAMVAGCAATGLFESPPQGAGSARTPSGQSLAPQAAREMIAIGKSTKADVSSALGDAIVIPFDSGHEVWVYRWSGRDRTTRAATELVLLFDPSGRVSKLRIRPGIATPG